MSLLEATARWSCVGTVRSMSYSTDLTDEQWALLAPAFNAPGKRGRKHAPDLRTVVDAMLYNSHTGCQWRFLPESFGPWTRVWSQFRRWSRNGTWARALTVIHASVREPDGRAEATPSMVIIDTHLPRRAIRPHQGCEAHRGGRRDGATCGSPGLTASTHNNQASELMPEHLDRQEVAGRLELVLVDRGVTAPAASKLERHS